MLVNSCGGALRAEDVGGDGQRPHEVASRFGCDCHSKELEEAEGKGVIQRGERRWAEDNEIVNEIIGWDFELAEGKRDEF